MKKGRVISAIIAIALTVGVTGQIGQTQVYGSQSRSYNFSSRYLMSDSQANNIASIAEAQLGKTRYNLKYTEAWCADFVSDCAELAGLSDTIPSNGLAATLYSNVKRAGGRNVKKPQRGDLVFYYCKRCRRICHTGVMNSSYSSIEGNYSRKVSYVTRYYNDSYGHSVSRGTIVKKYVRPKYKGTAEWNVSSAVLKKGKSTKLLCPVKSKSAVIKNFLTSNSSVAQVSSTGKITAKRKGIAYITAVFKSGKTASLRLKVQDTIVKTSKINVFKVDKTLNIDEKIGLTVAVMPITSEQKVTFNSSDEKVLTVSYNGVVKAVGVGKATITIKSGDVIKKLVFKVVDQNSKDKNPVVEDEPENNESTTPETSDVNNGENTKVDESDNDEQENKIDNKSGSDSSKPTTNNTKTQNP